MWECTATLRAEAGRGGRTEGRRLIEGQDRDVNAKSRIEYLMETCEVTVGFERLLPISSRVRGAERGRRQAGRPGLGKVGSIPCTISYRLQYGPLLGREVRVGMVEPPEPGSLVAWENKFIGKQMVEPP